MDLQSTVPIYGVFAIQTVNCTNDAMTSTDIAASTTSATASLTLWGTNIASGVISGDTGPVLGFPSTVVPPTDATIAARTNPVSIGAQNPPASPDYTGPGPLRPVFTLLSFALRPVLDPMLQAAGVTVAGADVADLGANCSVTSLVP